MVAMGAFLLWVNEEVSTTSRVSAENTFGVTSGVNNIPLRKSLHV